MFTIFFLPYQVCNLCGFPMLKNYLLLIRDDSAGLLLVDDVIVYAFLSVSMLSFLKH